MCKPRLWDEGTKRALLFEGLWVEVEVVIRVVVGDRLESLQVGLCGTSKEGYMLAKAIVTAIDSYCQEVLYRTTIVVVEIGGRPVKAEKDNRSCAVEDNSLPRGRHNLPLNCLVQPADLSMKLPWEFSPSL